MIRGVMEIANYGSFAQAALVLFSLAFVAIVAMAVLSPRREMDHAARLPLDAEDSPDV